MHQMPSNPYQSLVVFSWRRAQHLVGQMARALGLGLTPCKPFLPRPQRSRLAADLVRFETLVRRLLVLLALDSPLPRITPRAVVHTPPAARAGHTSLPRRHLAIPAFRLADPAPRSGTVPPPRRPSGPLRPRILNLGQPLPPPEPWEYPPRPDELVPSQPLVRRLAALCNVFDNPAAHIARMARHLARSHSAPAARPYRLAPLPAITRARHIPQDEHDALANIHAEALDQLALIDSS